MLEGGLVLGLTDPKALDELIIGGHLLECNFEFPLQLCLLLDSFVELSLQFAVGLLELKVLGHELVQPLPHSRLFAD
jgi:hypothetical protein